MAFIGVFGATVADELDALDSDKELAKSDGGNINGLANRGGLGGGFGGAGGRQALRGMAVAEGAPMAAAAPGMAPGADKNLYRANLAADAAPGEQRKRAAEAELQPGAAAPLVEATVRTNFADTAKWVGSLTTDKTGIGEVEVEMPENLTAWKIRVWAMGHGTKVGSGEADVVTRKNLKPRGFLSRRTKWC
jgi:hypothetical protein